MYVGFLGNRGFKSIDFNRYGENIIKNGKEQYDQESRFKYLTAAHFKRYLWKNYNIILTQQCCCFQVPEGRVKSKTRAIFILYDIYFQLFFNFINRANE